MASAPMTPDLGAPFALVVLPVVGIVEPGGFRVLVDSRARENPGLLDPTAVAGLAQDFVFWLVLFAWGGLGAAFGPGVILGLYWPRTTRWGAVAGMVTGALVTIGSRIWLKEPTGVYELIPGFIAALTATWLVSLVPTRRLPAPR
jgi:Na+/pantothenate symporter